MKSVPKLIRRSVGILLLSSIVIIIMNIILLASSASWPSPNSSPWETAKEAAGSIVQTSGTYALSDATDEKLKRNHIWAIYIDNATGQVVWSSDNLPENIPLSYTASDISNLTRGYIEEYPTFTGSTGNGLMILGYPKDSFWKHMWPSWDYHTITNLPYFILGLLGINICVILLIYVIANSKLLKSVKPIIDGIQELPTGKPVYLKEKGLLSELAANINQTSEILRSQSYQLKRKDAARANWIAGVSHDIRTPLSMVMGYAAQLVNTNHLTDNERQKAAIIVKQSNRMRNLINDLNLASKLEYNMQPIKPEPVNLIAIVRQVIVDFMNLDINGQYPIEWTTDTSLSTCMINADKDLIKRAVSNLIQNSINHNEKGCTIYVSIAVSNNKCHILVADDGIGAATRQIENLNNIPHYMVCDDNTSNQQHGLGLLIVKQIATSHNGYTKIEHSPYGGFAVKIVLPVLT